MLHAEMQMRKNACAKLQCEKCKKTCAKTAHAKVRKVHAAKCKNAKKHVQNCKSAKHACAETAKV
jgi:hypothetical protein